MKFIQFICYGMILLIFLFSFSKSIVSADEDNFTVVTGRDPIKELSHLPNIFNSIPLLWPEAPGIQQHGNINIEGEALFGGTVTATRFVGDGSRLTGISGGTGGGGGIGGSGTANKLAKFTASTTLGDSVIAESGGKVGIGTTVPASVLHVKAASGDGEIRIQGSATTVANTARVDFYNSAGTRIGEVGDINSGADNIYLFADSGDVILQSGGANEALRVKSSGNVGIGTTAPTQKLDVVGNIKASGSVTQGSSREFKKNISYISTEMAMEAFMALNPVMFEYKADTSGEEHLGFIAEDVPDLVASQDRKHLNAMDLTAVLTKVVQEQQRIISELSERLRQVESKL